MKYEIREVQLLGWKKSTSKAPPQITVALLSDSDIEWFEGLTVAKGRQSGQLLEIAFKLSEQDDQCPPQAPTAPESGYMETEAPMPTASELYDAEGLYGDDGLDEEGFPVPQSKSQESRFAIQRKAKKREASEKQKGAAIKNYRAQPKLTRDAIGLCNNPAFQEYMALTYPVLIGKLKGADLCAKSLYHVCKIKSRKELTDDNIGAVNRFEKLVVEFKAWRDGT